MVNVTYIDPTGEALTLGLPEGWSLMQGAVANGVDGIVGECGGSCVCATCHCYVEEARLADLSPASADELDLLDSLPEGRQANSRLACQIKASPAIEGLVITVAPVQV
ncbi:MAG TPA: 2Fe-2S iron-sulfur cluster-binding protein [Burkholderiaceae bacterium]|jgi:2Fe-2S ferredoxin|nr:2Fe-2S iron-sulfur cluster-binding protein [Burkholderiaceae bacterium]